MWLKDMEKSTQKTFINLMQKLSDVFYRFETDLYDELEEEDEDTRVVSELICSWTNTGSK